MRIVLVFFELVVGLMFGLAAYVFFATMAWMAEFELSFRGMLFSVGLSAGPLLLMVGPVLTLIRATQRLGAILVVM